MATASEVMLADRTLGKVPVSIATSLAMEMIFGIHDDHPNGPVHVHRYQSIWFNLRTLLRNIVGAVESPDKKALNPEDLYRVLVEEMMILENAISQQSSGKTRAVFYYPSYRSVKDKYPLAMIKTPSTDAQRLYATLSDGAFKQLLKDKDRLPGDFREFDIDIDGKGEKSLIVTHYPIDLLSRYRFGELELLESHTGAIKGHLKWNTKLTGGDELTRIPFNRMTLQVFGDKSVMFVTMLPKIKNQVKRMAEEHKWTPATTRDKIISNLQHEPDRYGADVLKSML